MIDWQEDKPELIRRYIEQQTCWICGKGGWKALSQHLVKKHQVFASEVREMAYMFKRERLISEELSKSISKDALKRFGKKRHIHIKGNPFPPKIISSKLRDILKSRLKKIRPVGPLSEKTKHKISQAHREAFQSGKIPWNKLAKQKRIHDQRSKQAKEYWRRFKELPIEDQHRLGLEKAASRRNRVAQRCIVCGMQFEIIPSQAGKLFTCRSKECKSQLKSHQQLGRKHTPEAIGKMSAHARKRHITEPLFGKRLNA